MKDKNVSFIVFDIETGGLDCAKNPIIEVAFIILQKDESGKFIINEELSFDSLVLPYDNKLKIEQEALNVNKISIEEIEKNGNLITDIVVALKDVIKELNPKGEEKYKPILVGHNIHKFDIDFLSNFLSFVDVNLYSLFSKSSIDTYTEARRFFEGKKILQSLSLVSICNYFGIEIEKAHRAYYDALANAKMFILFTEMFEINRRKILELGSKKK